MTTTRPNLGTFGVWGGDPVSPEVAVEIENLGYGAVWVSSAAPSDLSWAEPILDQTATLDAATRVLNRSRSAAGPVADASHGGEARSPGRLLLGIGGRRPE